MKYQLRKGVSLVEVENGIVLLDGKSGKYWDLNPTGALVLKKLLDGGSPEDAAADLVESFGIDISIASEDTVALVTGLKDAGLVDGAQRKGIRR